MADNITVTEGTGPDVATDDVAGVHYQVVKIAFGTDGSATLVHSGAALPITAPAAIPVSDGGASLTVDGTVTVDSELTTADLDTAGGTDTRAVVGLVGSASGGAQLIPGDATNGLYVQVRTMPAAARTTDHIGAALQTDAIMNALTALTPKFAFANVAASTTDGSIVAAVASKRIRVLSFRLHAGGTATNVTFNTKPGGAGSAISELFALPINGQHNGEFNPIGHFQSGVGEGLTVTTGAGATTGIGVTYVEV